jgi:hypothetical protein
VRRSLDCRIRRRDGDWTILNGSEAKDRTISPDGSVNIRKILTEDKTSHLPKRTGIKQQIDPLVRRQLAALMLTLNTVLPRRAQSKSLPSLEFVERALVNGPWRRTHWLAVVSQ